jgi:hypothetical protein
VAELPGQARHFGVAEANRLVPLLEATFLRIRAELSRLDEIAVDHLARLRAERDSRLRRIQEELETLADLGIEVKAVDGLVDFRAMREGRTVYLCWRYGEPEVSHWHELDTGFAGRQRIDTIDAFAPSYDC